jgi:hypothetical protein
MIYACRLQPILTLYKKVENTRQKEIKTLWLLGFYLAKFEGSFGSHNLECAFKRRTAG